MPRPTSHAIEVRNEKIITYIAAHPDENYAEVGKQFGMTSIAINRVAIKHGVYRGKGNRSVVVDEIDLKEVERRWENGESFVDIAADLGVTAETLRLKRHRAGMKAHPKTANSVRDTLQRAQSPMPVFDEAGVLAALADPMRCYDEIGDAFGVSKSTVSRFARRHGLMRTQGRKKGAAPVRPAKDAKCFKCEILLDQIDEGVALVRYEGLSRPRKTCQDCVERYPLEVVEWVRPMVEMQASCNDTWVNLFAELGVAA